MSDDGSKTGYGRTFWDVIAILVQNTKFWIGIAILAAILVVLARLHLITIKYDDGLKVSFGSDQPQPSLPEPAKSDKQKSPEQPSLSEPAKEDSLAAVSEHQNQLVKAVVGSWILDVERRSTLYRDDESSCGLGNYLTYTLNIKPGTSDNGALSGLMKVDGSRLAYFSYHGDSETGKAQSIARCLNAAGIANQTGQHYDTYRFNFDVSLSPDEHSNVMHAHFLQNDCDAGCLEFDEPIDASMQGTLTFDDDPFINRGHRVIRLRPMTTSDQQQQ